MKKLFFLTLSMLLIICCCKKNDYGPYSLFFYPSCFTPNGDGLNDCWFPVGGQDHGNTINGAYDNRVNYDTYKLKVLNQKNKVLFETDSINKGWDGTYKGDSCPPDYYYYNVTYESLLGKKYRDAGMFELLRN